MNVRVPPPPLGHHNEYTFSNLLGFGDDLIEALRAEHVIGEEPLGFEL